MKLEELLGENSNSIGNEEWETEEFRQEIDRALRGNEKCGSFPERPARVYFWIK